MVEFRVMFCKRSVRFVGVVNIVTTSSGDRNCDHLLRKLEKIIFQKNGSIFCILLILIPIGLFTMGVCFFMF